MPVDDWAPEIKTNMEAVRDAAVTAKEIPTRGEVYSYNEWPAALLAFPSIIIGTLGGSQDYSIASPRIAHHNVRIWIFMSEGLSLAETQKMAWPFVERVRDQFAQDLTLGEKVNHFIPPTHPAIFYEVGVISYGGQDYGGIIFNYDLKETETFTVQA